jgi:hypothetical protein
LSRVPNIIKVEQKKSATTTGLKGLNRPANPVFAQPIKIYPLLEIDSTVAVGRDTSAGEI